MLKNMTENKQVSDKEHFEAIVRRYQSPLLRYVRSSLGEHDAQDAVQEVFLRLHKTMRKNGLRDIDSVGTWLFKVAHNCTTDVLCKRKIDDKVIEAAADTPEKSSDDCDGLDEVVHREDCRLALKLLDKLPARERQAVLLRVSEGMSYREIGKVTDQATGTVGYLINQGLGRLARELKTAGAI